MSRAARAVAPFPSRVLAGILLVAWAASPTHAQEVIEYYGTDALGSIRVVFDASGTVVARTDYLPFGETFEASGSGTAEGFAGQAWDGEAGLDYFHARMYQPRTGRFNAVDPVFAGLFDPQQWNRYAYVGNKPTVAVDPSGAVTLALEQGAKAVADWVLNYYSHVTAPAPPWPMKEFGLDPILDLPWGGGGAPGGSTGGDLGGEPGDAEDRPDSNGGTAGQGPTQPAPPPKPKPPKGGKFLSCRDYVKTGEMGRIDIDQPSSGNVRWGVTLRYPVIGWGWTFEWYTRASGKSERNISRALYFPGTGGTMHGSQKNLAVGSIYYLAPALALTFPTQGYAWGTAACTVE